MKNFRFYFEKKEVFKEKFCSVNKYNRDWWLRVVHLSRCEWMLQNLEENESNFQKVG